MMTKKHSAEKTVQDIRRATRRHYSAEEMIRIVLEGLRGEDSLAELCRWEGVIPIFTIAGRRNCLKQVKNGLRVTRFEKRRPIKSKPCCLWRTVYFKKCMIGDGGTIHEVYSLRKVPDHSAG